MIAQVSFTHTQSTPVACHSPLSSSQLFFFFLMCIVFFAIGKEATGGRRLVLAANRDEFFKRPTAPASFWSDAPHVLGGERPRRVAMPTGCDGLTTPLLRCRHGAGQRGRKLACAEQARLGVLSYQLSRTKPQLGPGPRYASTPLPVDTTP